MGSFEPERWFIDKCGAAKGYSGAGIWETEIGGTRISKWIYHSTVLVV